LGERTGTSQKTPEVLSVRSKDIREGKAERGSQHAALNRKKTLVKGGKTLHRIKSTVSGEKSVSLERKKANSPSTTGRGNSQRKNLPSVRHFARKNGGRASNLVSGVVTQHNRARLQKEKKEQ